MGRKKKGKKGREKKIIIGGRKSKRVNTLTNQYQCNQTRSEDQPILFSLFLSFLKKTSCLGLNLQF